MDDKPLPIHAIVDGVAMSWWDDGKIRRAALVEHLIPYTESKQPKFEVGDWVIHNHKNRELGQIVNYFPDERCCYSVRFGKEYHNMAEDQLLPYIEEKTHKFNKGDKVEHIDIPGIFEVINYKEKFGSMFYELSKDDLDNFFADESVLKPYTEPETKLTEDMGTKEVCACYRL